MILLMLIESLIFESYFDEVNDLKPLREDIKSILANFMLSAVSRLTPVSAKKYSGMHDTLY